MSARRRRKACARSSISARKESVLLGCSTDEAALRRVIEQTPPKAPQIVAGPVRGQHGPARGRQPDHGHRSVGITLIWTRRRNLQRRQVPRARRRLRRRGHLADADPDPRCAPWQSATTRITANDPNLRYVPQPTRAHVGRSCAAIPGRILAATRATLKRFWALQLKLVKPFERRGVPMLAGSDRRRQRPVGHIGRGAPSGVRSAGAGRPLAAGRSCK